MTAQFTRLEVKNYRSLADLSLELGATNVCFGPNGSGKSTLLDTIWFFRDCAIRGVSLASSTRSHGIGLLWDGAEDGAQLEVSLSTGDLRYDLRFSLSAGRIEPFAGEFLASLTTGTTLINRSVGLDAANLVIDIAEKPVTVPLREPEKLSLGLYLDFNQNDREASALDRLLQFVRFYHSRSFLLHRLKQQGSEANYETSVWERGDNLWSVLRNLHDRKAVDDRYDTIMQYMARSFPSFSGLRLEQTGPTSIYAYFREKGRRKEIYASGVSDGHLQMLLLLTAIFCESPDRPAVLLLDEPEVSLHPWPLAVFAEAVKEAARYWNKQILIATHSPVLLSQFDVKNILATEVEDGCTHLRRLSEIQEVQDLLEEYSAGSLYMVEAIGGHQTSINQVTEG